MSQKFADSVDQKPPDIYDECMSNMMLWNMYISLASNYGDFLGCIVFLFNFRCS